MLWSYSCSQFLFGIQLKNKVTGTQNGMPTLQYFTVMPCDLEGSLLHSPNGPNLEALPMTISWTVMVREHSKI